MTLLSPLFPLRLGQSIAALSLPGPISTAVSIVPQQIVPALLPCELLTQKVRQGSFVTAGYRGCFDEIQILLGP